MEKDIIKEYNKLKEKYSLPDINEISSFFEIYKIDQENFLLIQIRQKIVEKLIRISEILENFLHPDTTMSNIYECRAFNDFERDEMFELYKKLKVIEKQSTLISLDSDEQKEAEFIKQTLNSWNEIKEKMIYFITKLENFWKSKSPEKTKEGYFG
ncbi:MAG: hypothetical protein PHV16_01715 [Candidatus Nanoarchaeia archaeon]|nr:hypothetical protein [Candidatus Nanoarchaeia archaeon]